MNHESAVFSYLASAASRLINEMSTKHDADGEFLPEINNPHLHKLKHKLLASYCDLVIEVGIIAHTYNSCKKTGKSQFKQWVKKLAHSKRIEHNLYFDSFIDIGGDH